MSGIEDRIIEWERLAEAWANVMDGRRIGSGLNAARISGGTTNSDDWHAIAAEYDRLVASARPCARYALSDGTLCSSHHGRFASPSENRCDRRPTQQQVELTEPWPLQTTRRDDR